MNAPAKSETLAAFLVLFDAYEHARQQLRAAEDGSDDERYCISNCASLWQQLLNARNAVGQRKS